VAVVVVAMWLTVQEMVGLVVPVVALLSWTVVALEV
jgi:hypothetical protein